VDDVGFARLVGYEDGPVVADNCRVDMLVTGAVLGHRRDMQPALVRECRRTHIRRMYGRRAPEPVINKTGCFRQLYKLFFSYAGLKPHFQYQVRDNADEVGVTAALTYAVDGTLHLPHTCTYSHQ